MPVVPWNAEQSSILSYEPFILLLHQLGFHLPAENSKLFVRVPEFWTADMLFNVAKKLGPIDQSKFKHYNPYFRSVRIFFSLFFNKEHLNST